MSNMTENATAEAATNGKLTSSDWLLSLKNTGMDLWNSMLAAINVQDIIEALVVLAAFLLFRRLLTRLMMNRLQRLVEHSHISVGSSILKALKEPIRFIPVVLGIFFALECLNLPMEADAFFNKIVRALFLFVLFWGLFNMTTTVALYYERLEHVLSTAITEWLVKVAKCLIILVGAASILKLFGIDVGPILAGLGLFSVAVALGAKDLFQNIIAGISFIAESRFNVGDWIAVDGNVEGTVETIGFRSTKIRRFDMAPTYVPNSVLSDSSLINYSKMTHRRIFWTLGVEYGTTVDQLRLIQQRTMEYIESNDEFIHPSEISTFMRVVQFNDSSIDFQLYAFTQTTDWMDWLRIQEELSFRIKQIVEDEAKAAFAFPSQSLYVETIPGVVPKEFMPPKATGK